MDRNAAIVAWNEVKDVYAANGLIRLPGIGTKFTQNNGFLTGYKPLPAGKKLLQPRTHEITWGRVAPAPA